MDALLFEFNPFSPDTNLLPYDGEVFYFGKVFSLEECARFYKKLLSSIEWRNDETLIFGRRIVTEREVAWYGDERYRYRYSGTEKQALPWTPALLELRSRVQELSGALYNSCLLNLYHSGEEGMGWHSDDEKTLQREAPIASVSFGATRKFAFRHKETKETVALMLEPGSLLVMQGATQRCWRHALPKMKKVNEPRINLTFRSILI